MILRPNPDLYPVGGLCGLHWLGLPLVTCQQGGVYSGQIRRSTHNLDLSDGISETPGRPIADRPFILYE